MFSKQNEYVIYEIETKDINNCIKVFIDGYTDESERKIKNRFNKVKLKYIEAKGILAKSSNFEMMKHRIAHTLSTSLDNDDIDGIEQFNSLINRITKEHEQFVHNRLLYMLPAVFSLAFFFAISYYYIDERITNTYFWQIISSLLAASLGGALSLFINVKSLNFEEYQSEIYYIFLGIERVLLSFITGGIAFIALKSGFLASGVLQSGYWATMLLIVISSFSESLIPSALSKFQKSE